MDIRYYPNDPAFDDPSNVYAEHGTIGYAGRGWYYFVHSHLYGPFDSEEAAILGKEEQRLRDEGEGLPFLCWAQRKPPAIAAGGFLPLV